MYHKFDAASHMIVMLFLYSVEDLSDDFIKVICLIDDCLDHPVLDSLVLHVNLLRLVTEHRPVSMLNNDGVHYPLDELHVRVDYHSLLGLSVLPLVDGELFLCLLKHLLLHLRDSLPFCLLLFANLSLILSNLVPAALSAPPLSLLGAELVSPMVATLTLNADDCHLFYCDNSYLSVHLRCLATYGVDDLDAVVAKALLAVHKVPELNFAAMTSLLGRLDLYDWAGDGFLLTTLLDSGSETVVAHVCTWRVDSWAHWLRIFVFSSGGLGAFGLLGLSCHGGKIGSVNL